jgi:putative membrane protein
VVVLRLALNEVGKFTARPLSRLALIALTIIPLLYSSLYLYANSDPYGNLKNLPVAIVNNDHGSSSTNMGTELFNNLKKDGTFNWQLADASTVQEKISSGEYSFALVIGEDFTENISKLANFEAGKTDMELMLNDANSYILHQIAEQVSSKVTAEVANQVAKQVILLQLKGIVDIRTALGKAVDGANQLSDGLETANNGASQIESGVYEFADALVQLKNGLNQLNKSVQALPSGIQQLQNGSGELKNGLDQVNGVTQKIGNLEGAVNQNWRGIVADLRTLIGQSTLNTKIKTDLLQVINNVDSMVGALHADVTQYVGAINQLDAGAGQLNAGIAVLGESADKLVLAIGQLSDGAYLLQTNFGKVTAAITELSAGLEQLSSGAHLLATELKTGVDSMPNLTDEQRAQFAEVVTDPVTFKTSNLASAGGYAMGLAPFFMALSGWIGVYILFVLMKPISTRALIANVRPWKIVLSGWLPLAVIGIMQMLAMFIALHFIINLTPVYTLLTILFLFLMALTYLTIVHFLVTALGKVGLFFGLVLMVIQLTSSGGTFPWQTLPSIDQVFYHIFPMPHAVDALRNLIYGGSLNIALQKSLLLVGYLVVFAALDILVVRIRRRWSMNTLFPAI